MKRSRFLLSFVCLMMFALSMLSLTACSENGSPHTHVYDKQIVNDTFKASDATCEDKAEYYFSCSCGEIGTETFKYGETSSHFYENGKCKWCEEDEIIAHTHTYDKQITESKYLKEVATCETKAIYYYSCSCGEKGTETFDYGTALGHTYGEWVSNGDDTHTKTCDNDNSHTVTESCSGGTATCIKKAVCEVCYQYYGKEKNTHDYNTLKYDSENHWYECLCAEKQGVEKHNFNEYISNNDGTKIATCFCGASESIIDEAILEVEDDIIVGLTDYGATLETIVIPKSINEVGRGAFQGCTYLTSIAISNSVTSIGAGAFYYCTSLISVTFDENSQLTSIGYEAFSGCTSLTSIVIPDSVTSIGKGAFKHCSSLEYNIKDGLKYLGNSNNLYLYLAGTTSPYITTATIDSNCRLIGSNAFSDCNSLPSITIPNSVTSIDYYAFSDCSSLRSIEIPKSVTSIGYKAFSGCSSLRSIEIPDSVTSIGNYAFAYCNSLTSIVIPDSVTSIGNYAFAYCNSLTSIVIPDSVTSIGDEAFYSCDSLTSVTFDENSQLTSIGCSAFSDCSSLRSIEIPKSVTSIGDSAFSDCSSLTSIVILDSVTSIGYVAFYGCSSLEYNIKNGLKYLGNSINPYLYLAETTRTSITTATIDSNCKFIGSYAFYSCDSLTSIKIPNSVTSIGDWAFRDCSSLTSVVIGNSVTIIDKHAFSGCTSLTSVTFDENSQLTSIGAGAFYCSSLRSIVIPDSVTNIGEDAFYGCSSLRSIVIPDSVTNIGEDAFSGCSSLRSIEIPDSVTSIGDFAFSSCESLTSVTIPDSVTSIGNYAFAYCNSLTSIVIPDSVTSIGDEAFHGCSSLEYNIKNGLNYLGNSNNPYLYLAEITSTSITTATIDSNCKFIGSNAFSGCNSLTSITIPNSVTSIGYSAFSDCSSLRSIEIPNSVTSIDSYAFYGCSSLTSIVIPDSVTSIGYLAFKHCSSLEYNIKNGLKYLGNSNNPYLYLAETTRTSIKTAIIDSNCKFIGSNAFSGCNSLTGITIPNSVKSIGYRAFDGCNSLKGVVIPDNVIDIDAGAFDYCTSLTIYCEAESKPSGWNAYWNVSQPVIWGYK